MTSYIRLNQFVSAANEAYFSPISHCLIADKCGVVVHPTPLTPFVSSEMREENKRTWRVFKESLIETIGKQKFDWICQRYRSNLNFTYLERSGRPLLPEHVELFSIGASQLLNRDIKVRFPEKLKTLTRMQLQERIRMVQPFPIVGHYEDPLKISGKPKTLRDCIFHNKVLMDKEKQQLFSDVEYLSFFAWMERFAKVIVNRELIEGQIIPAPGQDGRLDYYKVYHKIADKGLVAYALKPAAGDSSLKPLIVFRPSQLAISNEDAFDTYLNDVQLYVGQMGWSATQERFAQLMKDPHFRRNGETISIAGYSLGGTHAQRFLAEHYEAVSYAVFYNDPSVECATAEGFAAAINRSPRRREPLNIQMFRTRGDFCHYVGEKHVGWGVTHPDVNIQLLEVDPENKEVTAFVLHAHRIFDNVTFSYDMQRFENSEELFKQLDNFARGPEVFWYERMRSLYGQVAFVVCSVLAEIVKFISGILGISILRSSRDFKII